MISVHNKFWESQLLFEPWPTGKTSTQHPCTAIHEWRPLELCNTVAWLSSSLSENKTGPSRKWVSGQPGVKLGQVPGKDSLALHHQLEDPSISPHWRPGGMGWDLPPSRPLGPASLLAESVLTPMLWASETMDSKACRSLMRAWVAWLEIWGNHVLQ